MKDDSETTASRRRSPKAWALSRAIRAARGGMSQVAFSEMLGRKQSTVSYWETGLSVPSLDHLAATEETLGLPLGTLALEAGYFSPEAVLAQAGTPEMVRAFKEIEPALEMVRAASVLGFGVRLIGRAPSGAEDRDALPWLVEVHLGTSSDVQA